MEKKRLTEVNATNKGGWGVKQNHGRVKSNEVVKKVVKEAVFWYHWGTEREPLVADVARDWNLSLSHKRSFYNHITSSTTPTHR
jgi:hypothetical protein